MFYLINNGQIVGSADSADNLPKDFFAVEYEESELSQIYWDGEAIQLRPSKPSGEFFWSNQSNSWEAIASRINSTRTTEDWGLLTNLLQSSQPWIKAYAASERTLKANTAYTTLLMTLLNVRQVDTLEWSIARLREAMEGISNLGDFSIDEIIDINGKLQQSNFTLRLEHPDLPPEPEPEPDQTGDEPDQTEPPAPEEPPAEP